MYEILNNFLDSHPGSIKTPTGKIAWSTQDLPRILDIVSANQWIVLGGDILTLAFEYTCDNWYYIPNANLSLSENVSHSVQKSRQYLSEYCRRNGNNFLCVLTISNSYIEGKWSIRTGDGGAP